MTTPMQEEGYQLVGAAMEVYNVQGYGFLEEVYQESLELELEMRNIPFLSEPEIRLFYKNREMKKKYRPDLLVFDEIIVELKAIRRLGKDDYAQIINYLKSTKKKVGYLLNFGNPQEFEWKRFML